MVKVELTLQGLDDPEKLSVNDTVHGLQEVLRARATLEALETNLSNRLFVAKVAGSGMPPERPLFDLTSFRSLIDVMMNRHYGVSADDTICSEDHFLRGRMIAGASAHDVVNEMASRYELVRSDVDDEQRLVTHQDELDAKKLLSDIPEFLTGEQIHE